MEEEWLCQLKEKFASASTRSEQVTILTLLLKSWPLRRAEKEFSTTLHMARQARRLVEEKGIMTSPNPRQGRTLPAEVAEKVVQFFCCDEISRLMPGKKDYVTIREGEEKKQVQKRLVLCGLKCQCSSSNRGALKAEYSKSCSTVLLTNSSKQNLLKKTSKNIKFLVCTSQTQSTTDTKGQRNSKLFVSHILVKQRVCCSFGRPKMNGHSKKDRSLWS